MNYHLTEQQFLDRFENTDFVLKTQAQIVKDFERSGQEIELSTTDTLSLEDLKIAVSNALAKVMESGETNTLQLLYQIDIPQDQFLALTTDADFLSKVAYLIIRREALKVHLRSIYK